MKYYGVDLHRNSFLSCCIDETGKEKLRNWSIKQLKLFVARLNPEDEVAVEATGNSYLFCENLKVCGCKVAVVNPHQFKVISRSVNKTDENDTRVLACFFK